MSEGEREKKILCVSAGRPVRPEYENSGLADISLATSSSQGDHIQQTRQP